MPYNTFWVYLILEIMTSSVIVVPILPYFHIVLSKDVS